ncbi:Type I inositol 1,4,5-trisphosphate 5-phosphatase 2 [Acorus calamus]|uniref:Type I inositol 1,4,5-trisphosphate 5-phosphatase 2 n=1 Tax=Acorus calamus TaxID=4465 RepID=A0AAV9C853_ACOCL|nr:Type I inositol 1,4,5-trisphosphate 5-phosphatase 2 [Acorus calamus]
MENDCALGSTFATSISFSSAPTGREWSLSRSHPPVDLSGFASLSPSSNPILGCRSLDPPERTMGNRRGRRSQSLGASIVIKKWLNIKPKVHEFSEDDEETESEDDGIETKTIMTYRVMIGTWNVAGKSPYSDLKIDEWLRTKEPADMYIIGFQEVVPLSAVNVLGVADDGPIPKWEAIIRRTLNRSTQPKEKYRSYSAPPSPDLMTSPPDDALPDEINIGGLDTEQSSLYARPF